MARVQGTGVCFALQEHAHGSGGGEGGYVPVAKEVNAVVVAAACAGEGEVEAC